MYVCGPTVYSDVHLGNCRTFISFDIIFRYLQHIGYNVRYVRNITDVGHLEDTGEDKISKKAKIEQLEPMEIAQKYTNSFKDVLKKFNVLNPSIEPVASGHITEQILIIEDLLEKNLAYISMAPCILTFQSIMKLTLMESYLAETQIKLNLTQEILTVKMIKLMSLILPYGKKLTKTTL